jgi:small subunit ribosomal protein S11
MKLRLHSLSIALSITSRSVTTWETYCRVRPMSTRSTSVSRPVRAALPFIGGRSVFDRHSPSVAGPKGPSVGIAHIQSSLSNTIISITDTKGNVKTWSSSGTVGFKGSRRSTNYAAQATAETVARNAVLLGFRLVEVRIQGLGYGKESSLRGLQIGGLIITKIHDITPMPHNGCRPPKKRRV